MCISRRQFILGAAAGLILPSYYDRALAYWENHGEALLEAPRIARINLFACPTIYDTSSHEWSDYDLHWGNPYEETPPMDLTYRQYARQYYGGEEAFAIRWRVEEYDDFDFDELMHHEDLFDDWEYRFSSTAKAYNLLKDLDLGPELAGKGAVGEIRFGISGGPAWGYYSAHGTTPLDISLLQKRLNDLQTGIRVSMLEGR